MTSDFEKLSDLRNPVSKITGQSRFGRISNRLTIIALNTITNILRQRGAWIGRLVGAEGGVE